MDIFTFYRIIKLKIVVIMGVVTGVCPEGVDADAVVIEKCFIKVKKRHGVKRFLGKIIQNNHRPFVSIIHYKSGKIKS